ncbi:MAG: hypothetical protein WCQ96_00685 [Patescibacteria group bacterium]
MSKSKSNPVPNLQIMTKCPMCSANYKKDDIKVINKNDGSLSIYLSCSRCKSSVVMLLMAGPMGVTSISIPTDITEEDLGKINGNNIISCDDVLEMYKFLKDN